MLAAIKCQPGSSRTIGQNPGGECRKTFFAATSYLLKWRIKLLWRAEDDAAVSALKSGNVAERLKSTSKVTGPSVTVLFLATTAMELIHLESHPNSDVLDFRTLGP